MQSNIFFCSNSVHIYSSIYIVQHEKQMNNILILCSFKNIPESNRSLFRMVDNYRKIFSDIIYLNDIIAPILPKYWRADQSHRNLFLSKLHVKYIDNIFLPFINSEPYLNLLKIFMESELSLIPDGLIDYAPKKYIAEKDILSRLKKTYIINYDNNFYPNIFIPKNIKQVIINLDDIKEIIYGNIQNNKKFVSKNILYLGQTFSMSNPKLMTRDEELMLYKNDIKYLSKKYPDYSIYFKMHPFSDYLIPSILKHILLDDNIKLLLLDNYNLAEYDCLKYHFKYISGYFSTGIIIFQKMFNIKYKYIIHNNLINPRNSNFFSLLFFHISGKSVLYKIILRKYYISMFIFFSYLYIDNYNYTGNLDILPRSYIKLIALSLIYQKKYNECISFINYICNQKKIGSFYFKILKMNILNILGKEDELKILRSRLYKKNKIVFILTRFLSIIDFYIFYFFVFKPKK